MLGASVIIIVVNVAVFQLVGWQYKTQLRESLTDSARSFYKLIVVVRAWAASHQGIYVPYREGMEVNPYLPAPSLLTMKGDTMVWRNPAMITRELSELSTTMGKNVRFHVTSLSPVNPGNRPDAFERQALLTLQRGDRARLSPFGEFTRFEQIEGRPHFRYFAPLYTEESCLSCHGAHGYQVGDVRGGISIVIPTDSYEAALHRTYGMTLAGGLLASLAISGLIYVLISRTVIRPLRGLETAAAAIGQGNYDSDIPIDTGDEIGDVGRAMAEMQQAIRTSISTQVEAEKMFALGQLSAGIAHEIRNPLFAIRNDLDYLKRTFDSGPAQREIYDEMEAGLSRISRTVNAVLDFARPHKPEYGRFAVREVLDRTMALLGKQLEKEAIAVTVDIADDVPAVEMDIHKMEQVCINLLTNAMQAIDGRPGHIDISVRRGEEAVTLDVRDNGRGIRAVDLPRIFDPFFTRSPNGTGLGLTIVRRVVDQHHGTVRVRSTEGAGTVFSIALPIRQSNEAPV